MDSVPEPNPKVQSPPGPSEVVSPSPDSPNDAVLDDEASLPPVSLEDTRRYLSLFGNAEGSFTYQTLPDSKSSSTLRAQILHGTIEERVDQLNKINEVGHGIFLMINGGDGKGRATENVTSLRALFIDEDLKDGAITKPFHLPPSLIVKSGGGRHIYWRLKPGEPLEAFKEAQQRLAAYYGTDPKVCDLPRVLRVAGFYHRKGNPVMVTVASDNHEASYSIAELLEGIPALPAAATPSTAIPEIVMTEQRKLYASLPMKYKVDAATPWLVNEAPPAVQGDGGHAALMSVAGRLINGYQLDYQTAFDLILEHYNPRCTPPWPGGDIEHKLRDAFKESRHDPANYLAEAFAKYARETGAGMPKDTPEGVDPKLGAASDPYDPLNPFHIIKPVNIWCEEPDEEEDWVVPNLFSIGSLSTLVADPKAGKSTLARTLTRAIASRGNFLGIPCKQGKVLYITGEGSLRLEKKHYRKMPNPENIGFERFRLQPKEFLPFLRYNFENGNRADMVIVDTVSYVLGNKNFNDQSEITKELKPMGDFAEQYNTHLCLLNHTPKNKMGGSSKAGGMGSTAFRGISSTNLVIEKYYNEDTGEENRTLFGEGRDDCPFTEKVFLSLDPETEIVTLGNSLKDASYNKDRDKIIDYFRLCHDAMTAEELVKAVHINARRGYETIHKMAKEGGLIPLVGSKTGKQKITYTLASAYMGLERWESLPCQ